MPTDTLGCCVNTAAVWDRCERTKIVDLDAVTCLSWSRELDDLSEASVTVGRDGACCEVFDRIRPWRHQLVINRCGRQVWSGPILRTTYNADDTEFEAVDPLAWLNRRLVRETVERCGSLVGIARELITEALEHPDGAADETCLTFDYRGCTHTGCRKYEECNAQTGAELRSLARGPLNFTAVGRRVIVWCGGATLGRTALLQDKDFMGALSVVEDGYSMATAVCVQGKGVTAYCGGTDPYFGLLEVPIKDDTITTEADAMAVACAEVAARSRPPLILSVPDGIRLDPSAPVTVDQLVPGVLIPVWSSSTCRTVREDMALTRLRVTQGCSDDHGGDEVVAITVAPAASIGAEA
jgi:hypothetical protein